ncbi:iron siderophore-binding protein [Brevibacillus agri]|uniref:Iron siderophore-binding protein n=1 Tax=Brevibacillus agri TaxID=51101 RepID=A0A3M8AUQ3_9BACL|nr:MULTISPECIES: iron-siderophore ABC transporter substrate-binding protein [Brevibacillus]EJL45628.1 ABC-type Fe3+-hydroxamate transport system, periplasmic component [Brevibacillus sp. CF112]MBG9566899.1 ABC transporter substrate-binding protein [Brevibacillus agri]QAV15690.1 iron-siderophore ABC transporter substrate-binding protein [Brevibacillus agri]RNB54934.1 iron-siderophore ABC transporter substrate-binding protein [Brevibacillus agri]GED25800.1 iron siderophore-binding protein [Brevi
MKRKTSARTMRHIMTSFFSLCMLFVLAGCGGGANQAQQTQQPAQQQATTEQSTTAAQPAPAEAGEVREIKHAMGTTQIKGTPQRVIILTNEGTEALLALGVKPIAAVQSWEGEPWYDHIKDEMAGVESLGFETEPNLEKIVSLSPDLIIGNKVRHEKVYDQLSKVAPTVFAEELSGRWKTNFALYAEAVNKKAEGEKVLKEFDERVAAAKEKLGSKTATKVSVAKFSKKGVQIYQKDTFSGVLLEQLGIARPASQDVNNFAEFVSEEGMSVMDGDVLFYWVSEEKGATDITNMAKKWMDSPVFKSLNVSKNNQVFQVSETIWNTAGGIKAANLLLDDIMKRLDVQ